MTTEKGKDESLLGELSPGLFVHKHYGHLFVRGGGFNTKAFDQIIREISEDRLVFFAFTGPPGSGKTYFALRLAEMLDPKFQVSDVPTPPANEDNGQVAFDRDHLNHLLSPQSKLKEYQCVVIDESHFGLGSRTWNKAVQQDIVNLLVACRSKRIIFMVVALNITQIDKYLRDFVVNYQFTIEDRGRATLYKRRFHKISGDPLVNRLGTWWLPLPGVDDCVNPDCIGCMYLFAEKNTDDVICKNIRAIYERRKLDFLNRQSIGNAGIDGKKKKPELKTIAEELKEYADQIPRRKDKVFRGQLKPMVYEALGYELASNQVTTIAGIIEGSLWWKERITRNPPRS